MKAQRHEPSPGPDPGSRDAARSSVRAPRTGRAWTLDRRPSPGSRCGPRSRRRSRSLADPEEPLVERRSRARRSDPGRQPRALRAQLYESYFPRVYRFALKRLGDAAEAEDVAQEVFFTVFNALPSYQGTSPLLVWIFGITRNTVNRRFRGVRPRIESLDGHRRGGSLRGAEARPPTASRRGPAHAPTSATRSSRTTSRRCSGVSSTSSTCGASRSAASRQALGKSEDAIKANLYRMRRAPSRRARPGSRTCSELLADLPGPLRALRRGPLASCGRGPGPGRQPAPGGSQSSGHFPLARANLRPRILQVFLFYSVPRNGIGPGPHPSNRVAAVGRFPTWEGDSAEETSSVGPCRASRPVRPKIRRDGPVELDRPCQAGEESGVHW